jgi:sodium transport system permease protein
VNLSVVAVVLRKELLDLFRDRRTLISLVLAPMLVGPVIMAGMNYYMRRTQDQAKIQRFKVGLRESVTVPDLRNALAGAGLEVRDSTSPREDVEKKEVTFGIEVTGSEQKPLIRFFSDNSDMTASMARSRVNVALDGLEKRQVRAELAKRNVPAAVLEPFSRESVNIAQPRKMTGAIIGRMIGFLLLIFLFNGAMYAAVDTTAGEKERRTIEVLLSSAAGRTEIVIAKILTAMTTSIGTTFLSMISYAVAFASMQRNSSGASTFSVPTDLLTIVLLFVLIVPLAILAASIAIAASTPAKSTREAMSYLTPGMFLVMFLGMVTFLPNVEASLLLAAIPFANFSQTLREVLSGELMWSHYAVTIGANLVYALIAAAAAVRGFRSEKILFRT